MIRPLLFIAVMSLAGCVTLEPSPSYGVRISNIDWPLLDLQKLVAYELPTGMRTASPNAREFSSRYFILDKDSYKPAAESLDRYTAHVTILGGERPYQLEITVDHEKRVRRDAGYTYQVADHNKNLAEELAYKIREQLTKRREDRNIIDDFRVF